MRKISLFVGVVFGAAVGLLTSLTDGIGLQLVMMSIGAVAGAAVGGALSRRGRESKTLAPADEAIPGMGFSPEDRMKRYWIEEGRLTSAPGIPEPDDVVRDPNPRC